MCDRHFRTFSVVDDFNCEALVIEIDQSIGAQQVISMLGRVEENRGYLVKILIVNSPILNPLPLAQWTEDHGVILEFIKSVKLTWNISIECFTGISGRNLDWPLYFHTLFIT